MSHGLFNDVLTTFLALKVVVELLSIQGQKALGFNQKYLKVPLLWIFENDLSCSEVNENIMQSFKSESAPCIKLLSLKRKSRLWIIETSRFKTNPKPFHVEICVL